MNLRDKIEMHLGFDSEERYMDGYDHCIAGVLERYGKDPIVVYDKEKVIDSILGISDRDASRDGHGMTREEAHEYFEYNLLGACIGDGAPAFLTTSSRIEAVG